MPYTVTSPFPSPLEPIRPEVEPQPYAPTLYTLEYAVPVVMEQNSYLAQLEQQLSAEAAWEQEAWWEQEYPNDTQAFRMFMQEVQSSLKESDAVHALRLASAEGKTITPEMISAVFRAYELAIDKAKRVLRDTLSPEQLHELKQASRTNLDWSYRHLLAEHATANDDVPLRYSTEDFFLIMNPKARKIEYMQTGEILRTLRHSMSQAGTDALARDVQTIRRFESLPAVQDAMDSQEFTAAEEKLSIDTNA